MSYRRRATVIGLAVASALMLIIPQSQAREQNGTPGMTVKEITQGHQAGDVHLDVDGPAQVNFREITIRPGGTTGRHCHYGQLIGVVKQGTLTLYASMYTGGVHIYTAGETIVEGSGYIHEGRNQGSEEVVLWVTYVTPVGKPLAEPNLSNCATG